MRKVPTTLVEKLNKCGPTIYLHVKAEEIFSDWEQLLGKGGYVRTTELKGGVLEDHLAQRRVHYKAQRT